MKNKEFKFRLSEELYKLLLFKSQTAQLSASDFMRTLIHNSEIKVNNKNDIGYLIGSVNKIGNNLNQIAKNINISRKQNLLNEVDYKNIINKLVIIEFQLNDILRSV